MELKGTSYTYEFDLNNPVRQRGKNGVVWIGNCKETGKFIIIKWHQKKPDFYFTETSDSIQSFIEEISNEGRLFRIYTYLNGIDLQKVFEEPSKKWKDPAFVVEKWIQTLEVLQTLHKNNYLHNDIKLSNILFDESTQLIRLIDLDNLQEFPLQKAPQRSYIFSSPEQYMGYKDLMGPWSDIFATGICFHSILARELPYPLNHPALLEQKQLAFPIPELEHLPKELNTIFQKCCKKPFFSKPPGQNSTSENVKALVENITLRYTKTEDLIEDLKQLEFKSTKKWYRIW